MKSEEDVQPEENFLPQEDVLPEEKVQPTEPTQPEDVEGSYQNDPYKSVTQEQNTFYGESNNYEYGQGYGQQNQNYTQQGPNYGQQNQGYYQQNNFNGMPQKPVNWVPYLILSIISTLWESYSRRRSIVLCWQEILKKHRIMRRWQESGLSYPLQLVFLHG